MKDPFGNYVVQKVLETCDDQSLALIISRIKVHLNALKRYTYGKHIVTRVEKLITTGGEYLFSLCINSSKTKSQPMIMNMYHCSFFQCREKNRALVISSCKCFSLAM